MSELDRSDISTSDDVNRVPSLMSPGIASGPVRIMILCMSEHEQ